MAIIRTDEYLEINSKRYSLPKTLTEEQEQEISDAIEFFTIIDEIKNHIINVEGNTNEVF